MNLNDTNDGMVPLYPPSAAQNPPPKVPEKNIPKQQTKMDN
jgi:hypothetical protein